MLLRYLLLGLGKINLMIDELVRQQGGILSSFGSDYDIEELAKDQYDIILIYENNLNDHVFEVLRRVVSIAPGPRVIVFTAENSKARAATYLAAGCEAVLCESTPPEMIKQALETIIRKHIEVNTTILQARDNDSSSMDDFIAESPAMKEFMATVKKVMNSNSSLLIAGETGVGKEHLAQSIHRNSSRHESPFIAVNCAAIPDTLLESEFFGHERGAFTGALKARKGAFELAHKGTIFLDEIGDMSFHLQAKLLRVLQERRFQRLGGEHTITVDVRVIAATNRNLFSEVREGRFRRDLYYRLCVVHLIVPPLSERREDIPKLVHSYIDFLAPRIGVEPKDISPGAMDALLSYNWPGNVRELINVMERTLLLCDKSTITPEDLPKEIAPAPGVLELAALDERKPAALFGDICNDMNWKDYRRFINRNYGALYFEQLLTRCGGDVRSAAAVAGISERLFYLNCREFGLSLKNARRKNP